MKKINEKKFNQGKEGIRKGFSLIEAVTAIFIFSLAIVSVAGAFSSSFFSYKNSRAIQRDLEQAQNSMNLISKVLRTSSIISCSSSTGGSLGGCSSGENYPYIRIYDYSQHACLDYKISGNIKEAPVSLPVNITTSMTQACFEAATPSSSSFYALTAISHYITGDFYVVPSNKTATPEVVGRVTIYLEVCPSLDSSSCATNLKDKVRIQTSVSLRDYGQSGIIE